MSHAPHVGREYEHAAWFEDAIRFLERFQPLFFPGDLRPAVVGEENSVKGVIRIGEASCIAQFKAYCEIVCLCNLFRVFNHCRRNVNAHDVMPHAEKRHRSATRAAAEVKYFGTSGEIFFDQDFFTRPQSFLCLLCIEFLGKRGAEFINHVLLEVIDHVSGVCAL